MRRSKNYRTSSPLKALKTTTGQSEYDRIFQNVQEMFSDSIDADVIYFVLSECHWRSEEAIDKLLMIVEKAEDSPVKTKSKLQEIAESVLGPLKHEECQDQGHTHPTSSQNLASGDSFERLIGQQAGSNESLDDDLQPGFKIPPSSSSLNLQSKGSALSPSMEERSKNMHPVSSDPLLAWDFPPLQKDALEKENLASKSSLEPAGNESWRAIRAPKSSSRASSNSPHRNLGSKTDLTKSGFDDHDVFSESPNALKGRTARPRLEMNRNFPVRLLSKSPEEAHDKITFPQGLHHSVSESGLHALRKSKNVDVAQTESFELDETVIKCISNINNELLDESEKKVEKGKLSRSRSSSIRSQTSENESGGTGASTPDPSHIRTSTPSNHPMTLPVIGLSVEAPEFVPRPKKTKTEGIAQSSSDTVVTTNTSRRSPHSASSLKVDTKPTRVPAPVSSSHQGIGPAVRITSPRIAVPVVSPGCTISPPGNIPVTNSTNLTGSPVFITPKWPPVFPGIYQTQQPPPPLHPRLVPQQMPQQFPQHFAQGYRFQSPGAQHPAYPGVVYPLSGARPVFQVSRIPPRLSQIQNVQVMTDMGNNIVAMATGQPIMATGETVYPVHSVYPANLEVMKTGKRDKPSWKEVCVETVGSLVKAGRKIMVIVRGLPGSGKSTLARAIKFDGIVLSTDDYFTKGDIYEYDPDKITEAHQWNRKRANEAIKLGTSPIIIDNTNTQKWEFKPYVSMALNNNYHVEIMEPDTPWKFKPKELAKRTVHGVPEDQIERMLSRYEKNLTVAIVSNKGKKPLPNGAAETQSQNDNASMETPPILTVERKPLKSARVEAAKRSRSKGKGSKTRDLKAVNRVNKLAKSPNVGISEVNDEQDWLVTEEAEKSDHCFVQAGENTDLVTTDDWTADDWPALTNGSHNDLMIYEKSEADIDIDTHTNSDPVVTPNSGRSSVASLQGEVSFIPNHLNILSATSSKTASPIIEFDIVEAYSPSDKHETNISAENSDLQKDLKYLKVLESELRDDVLSFVNEVMEENANLNISELSRESKSKLVEELKALLQFYPIEDEEQLKKAEMLIDFKISTSEIETENTEMDLAENLIPEHYMLQESAELVLLNEQLVNEQEEKMIQIDKPFICSEAVNDSWHDVDAKRTSVGSLDLDHSLNKEVANILNVSHSQSVPYSSEIEENNFLETNQTETTPSVSNITNITELENQNKCNYDTENNRSDVDYNLEISYNGVAVDTTQRSNISLQKYHFSIEKPQESLDLSQIIVKHVSPKEKSLSPKEKMSKESIYEIDSAIIRAETSDNGETESLFEHDSAILAVSMDSSDRESLLETDPAIIAAGTDSKDTNSLNMFETDSAVIAASKELIDSEVVVDDADVMKRLKATVEELKYWGHIENDDEELESVEKVVTEWDGYEISACDEWKKETNCVTIRAKPQRKRRRKSSSNNVEDNISKTPDVQETNSKDNVLTGVLDTSNVSENEISSRAAGQQDKCDKNELLDDQYQKSLQLQSIVNKDSRYPLSCFNNNNEINELFPNYEEAVNFGYHDTEDIVSNAVPVPCQYEMVSVSLPDTENNIGNGELYVGVDVLKETDLDNSIFISDDEENLDNSHISKSDSDAWKTASSDDNIFISDDDMDIVTRNVKGKVDGLQTLPIQEESFPVENCDACVNDIEIFGKLNDNFDQEEITKIESVEREQPASSENSALYETASSIGNDSFIDGDTGTCNMTGNNHIEPEQMKRGSSVIIPLHTSSEISVSENLTKNSVCQESKNENDAKMVQQSVPPKKQRQSKRRIAAKLAQPFFDMSEKEKFAGNDWTALSSDFSKTKTVKCNKGKRKEETEFNSVGTHTESGDFRILNLFCQGEVIEYIPEYKFMKTRSRSIDVSEEDLARYKQELEKARSSEVRKIDKSSSTDDLKTDSDLENIQFLKTCFSNISEDELDCVLLNCANNVEWALNLLLDWKYHLDYTDEEKEYFVKEISERCPSPEFKESSNETALEKNPESLVDLCFKKIETEHIADRENLEKQLIQTGKERLDRIEDDNITKIRLRRSTSLSETSFDRSSYSAAQNFDQVHRSVSDPYQNIDSVFRNTSAVSYISEHLVKGSVISPIKKINEELAELEKSLNKQNFNDGNSVSGAKLSTKLTKNDVYDSERKFLNKTDDHKNVSELSSSDSSFINESASEDQLLENDISTKERRRLQSHQKQMKQHSSLRSETELVQPDRSKYTSTEQDRPINSGTDQEWPLKSQEPVESLSSIAEADRSLSFASERERSLTSPGPIVFTLALDKSVIGQLELLFGPVGENNITDCGDLEVPVNLETARLLHQCVRTGLNDDRFLKYKQMKEDEKLARKLQAEQDQNDSQAFHSPSKRSAGSLRGQPVSLAELAEQRMASLLPPWKREPVKPLAEIMEEEMSKEKTREELQKFLDSEGGTAAIATRMKRKKLYESFPKIDKTLLDQVFEANCYNLSETVESIQTSMSYQPVQTVMTREMEEEYDQKLIEAVKQQSAMNVQATFEIFSEDEAYADFTDAEFDNLRGTADLHTSSSDAISSLYQQDTFEIFPEDDAYEDFTDAEFDNYRGEAELHHKLRLECFQKAQDAHRKGLKQVAFFYSQQGHLHTQKLREANLRASEQILEDRHNDLETKMTLDLHGLLVEEAMAALDRILPEKEKERYKSHLIIITGRGRHSRYGIPRLRPAVQAYLQKHQYSFTELHPGAFRVTLKNR